MLTVFRMIFHDYCESAIDISRLTLMICYKCTYKTSGCDG